MRDVAGAYKLSILDKDVKICWNPCYRVESIENEGVFLFSEKKNIFLKGRSCLFLAPFISEASHTADELALIFEGQIPPETIFYTLARLEKKCLIQPNNNALPRETAAFCGLLDISEKEAIERLRASKIYVHFLGGEVDRGFIALLKTLKLEITSEQNQASFSLVIVKDYLQEGLAAFNQEALKRNHPWMIVRPFGSQVWLGPIFEPKKTGCWECLAFRLRINRLEESYVRERKDLKELLPPSHAMMLSTCNLALNFAATELFKYVVLGKNEQLEGKIITFDTLISKQQEHVLLKRQYCSCSSEPLPLVNSIERPLELVSRKKEGSNNAGFRSVPPEETIKKFSHLVSPIIGVVHSLEPISNTLGPAIHIYGGGANFGLPKSLKGFKVTNLRSKAGGKGTTEIDAKAGCLCESIERFSGVFQGDEVRIRGSYLALKDSAIHPNDVLLFSEEQYCNRAQINPSAHSFNKVSAPFLETAEIEWSPLWSMTEQRYKHLPTAYCYYEYPWEKADWGFYANSNGCAAGNSLEEAILQGFFELVERDCIALWWYNRLKKPFVDLKSFEHPYIETLLREYEQMGREVWILDLTSDLHIPSFVAISRMKKGADEKIFMGFGAHLDVQIALLRSLTEMNQFLGSGAFLEETVEDREDVDHEILRDWLSMATLDNQPYLKGAHVKSASDYLQWNSTDLLEDIRHCQNVVEKLGMEFLVQDQTRVGIGLPVARVVVPGLRHFWMRFAPGRLYDVPVKMGWLNKPLKESELNPIGVFL